MNIPNVIKELIEIDYWPNESNVSRQYSKGLLDYSLIEHNIPEEYTIYFFPPPFTTINRLLKKGDSYYLSPEVNKSLDEIDLDKTVIIADFGLGAESELALNFSENNENPSVIRLKWFYDFEKNLRWAKWVKVTDSFDEFAKLAGIDKNLKNKSNESIKNSNKIIEYILE